MIFFLLGIDVVQMCIFTNSMS